MTTLAMGLPDRTADISQCGRYRYTLTRTWDEARPPVLFVMLNPSTADAAKDDPTIRRCIGFAKSWNMGGLIVCNLYPWRATNPGDLPCDATVHGEGFHAAGVAGRIRSRNDLAIVAAADEAGRVILAWGANQGPFTSTAAHVLALLQQHETEALALTKDGRPRHPLYVPANALPRPYPAVGRWEDGP